MTRKLTEKKRAAVKAERELAKPGNIAKSKAKNHKLARLNFFDYYNHNNEIRNHRPPKVVIIVPVRDRDEHKNIVASIYKNSAQLKFIFVNQNWYYPFNKGAMLNIGFLEIKKLYPDLYQNITFVFHDVDIILFRGLDIRKLLDRFITSSGTIKHIYGFQHSLGGVFSITGLDYEKVGGSPNIYGWNVEDVILQDRVLSHNLRIDRSESHFVDVDNGAHALNLSYDIPFKPVYRMYLVSEWKRNTEEDNLNSLVSYSVVNEGCNVYVSSFQTSHEVQVDAKNIRVCSQARLPKDLMIKGQPQNVSDGKGWFINHWSEKLHGKVVNRIEAEERVAHSTASSCHQALYNEPTGRLHYDGEYSALVREGSALAREHSALGRENSSLVGEHSAQVGEGSALVREGSALAREHSALGREDSSLVGQHSAQVGEGSALVREGTALAREHSALGREDSPLVGEHSAQVGEGSADRIIFWTSNTSNASL
jgi:N-terminal region of glycosyl transferase group 7